MQPGYRMYEAITLLYYKRSNVMQNEEGRRSFLIFFHNEDQFPRLLFCYLTTGRFLR